MVVDLEVFVGGICGDLIGVGVPGPGGNSGVSTSK